MIPITVTAAELDLIGTGLGSVAYKDAAPLMARLKEQYLAYLETLKPVPEAPASSVE